MPRKRRQTARHSLWILLALGLVLSGFILYFQRSFVFPSSHIDTSLSISEAHRLLESLDVKPADSASGYNREKFGEAWADVDGNGCDTRNDILRRDLVSVQFKPGSEGCVVASGTLHDPYTGIVIAFKRGAHTSADVQIDHIVALSNAWRSGARNLSAERRRALANDPLNLLAVDGETNQEKGAANAAQWLPPNQAFHCEYVSRQIEVKARYGLWVTSAEKKAMLAVLDMCS